MSSSWSSILLAWNTSSQYIELITKQEDVLWFEVHNKRFTWDEDEDRMKFIGAFR